MSETHRPLSLSVEVNAKALAPMRRALRNWLIDVEAREISDVVLAVDEAVANAIEHAGLHADGVISVSAQVAGDILHVEVCDPGNWKVPLVNETRGRGLLIMNTVMDGVSIEHRTDHTRVAMSRQLR
jgi:serine/threonine-protein kinase RsbW